MHNLNSNIIVLIPKVPNADRIELFRPIACLNFQFKIITRIMDSRLANIASKIITENQRGPIQGRNILDYIAVTSEAINMLDTKAFSGNLSIKVDIKMVFDTMDWSFLI